MCAADGIPFVRPNGFAWVLEASDKDGYNKLRQKDNEDGYFWGKWWTSFAGSYASYPNETYFKLEDQGSNQYKLHGFAWDGTSTAYVYVNKGSEGDGSFRVAANSHEQAGLDDGYTIWEFISESDYATYIAAADKTSSITNSDFTSGLTDWTVVAGAGNKQAHGATAVEYWNGKAAEGSFDYYQSLSGLPAGKYKLRAAMYNSTNGEAGASFNTSGQCGVYGTTALGTAFAPVTVDATTYNDYSTDAFYVVDGNLRVGVKNNTTMTARWFGVDWIQLSYVGDIIASYAEALPDGDMVADKWYYLDIAIDGTYDISLTTLADIVYTKDATVEDGSTVTANFEGTDEVELTAGRYYVKSSSAQALTVKAHENSYDVGSVTAQSIAEGEYLKSLTTLVLTYGDAATNDGEASLAIIGTPVATLKKGGVTVTTSSTLTANNAAKTLTATFSDVNLIINSTDYSIEIPAGAFGYEGKSENAAVTVNFNTPLFADGDYYLKNKDNGAYFAGGNYWGTQAITNNIGHKVNLTAQSNGKYTIDTYLYNGGKSSANHFLNGLWCDGASADWQFVASDTYYQISNGTEKLTAGSVGATMTLTTGTGDDTKWTLLTPEAWKAEQVARLDDATKDNGVDATFYLAAPDFNRNDDIENEKWNGTPGIDGIAGNDVVSNYNGQKWNTNPFDVYQSQTGLKPGVYKLTMKGFYRNGTTDDRNAQLYANDYSVALLNIRSTKIAPVDSIKGFTTANGDYFVPNRQNEAAQTFNNGYYENTLYFAVGADGALRIGVKKDTDASGDWTVFDEFRLTYYGAGTITKTSSVNLQGYKTFYNADVNYEVDTNTTIYKAAAPAAGWVTLTEVNTDRIIPAGTPVILYTSNDSDYKITLTPTATASSNDFDGNALQVAATDGAIDGAYILAYKSGAGNGFGFWQYTGSLDAGDIYLTAAAGAKARLTIVLDGEANDIDEVEIAEEGDDDAPAVNVAGQTVGKDYKGIVIKAGKKYLQR